MVKKLKEKWITWFGHKSEINYKLGLKYCFTAHNGDRYYQFPTDVGLSIPRLTQVQGLLDRLNAGISGEEREKMLTIMEKAISDGLKHPENASKVATMVYLMRKQQGDLIQKEILLNVAATLLIHEDEDPIDINADMHRHKIKVFEKEITLSTPHSFFFKTSLKELSVLMKLSESEFHQLWEANLAKQAEIGKILDSMMSDIESALITEDSKNT